MYNLSDLTTEVANDDLKVVFNTQLKEILTNQDISYRKLAAAAGVSIATIHNAIHGGNTYTRKALKVVNGLNAIVG